MPGTELRTARLLLRRARADDLDAMHAILSNPLAMRYWYTLPHDTVAQTRNWLEALIAAPAQVGDEFVVEHAGQVIGKAGCYAVDKVTYIFRRDHWGKGLASEALAAVVSRAFDLLPITELRADVDPNNAASLRLLQRHGFEITGHAARTFQVGDAWRDTVHLALPRPAA